MMKEWIDIFGKALFNDFDDEDVMIANLFNEWEATPYTWIFLLWSFVFFLGTEDSSKTPYVFERKSIYISSWKIPHDDPPLKIRITTLTNKIPSLKQPSHPENRVFAASSIECTPPKTDILLLETIWIYLKKQSQHLEVSWKIHLVWRIMALISVEVVVPLRKLGSCCWFALGASSFAVLFWEHFPLKRIVMLQCLFENCWNW